MTKPVVLLGAGASIDAGLPNTFNLTEKIYDRLLKQGHQEALLFGFIIAKLITRNTKHGYSPFQKIDVETAYDAVKRILNRDSDVLSEFAQTWDDPPFDFSHKRTFDERRFSADLGDLLDRKEIFKYNSTRIYSYDINRKAADKITKELALTLRERAVKPYDLSVFIDSLASELEPEFKSYGYLDSLLELGSKHCSCVATLNYDSLLENAANAREITFDYGISSWNLRRYIRFDQSEIDLIKLHGSLNWYVVNRDEIRIGERREGGSARALIFGGQNEKLFSDGPFLSLREEFFRRLRSTNVCLVAGYSFSDLHINALLRSWMQTRRKAKIVIVNPGLDNRAADVLRYHMKMEEKNKRRTVEVKVIKSGLADAIEEARNEMLTPPDPPSCNFTCTDLPMHNPLPNPYLRLRH